MCKNYGNIVALRDVSASVKAGSVTCVLGDNGAGKSTFIKILSGVHKHDDGDLLIDGEAVLLTSPRDALDRGIATVYQDLALVPLMSVWRNFFLGAEPTKGFGPFRRFDVDLARETTRRELAAMGIDIRDPDQPIGQLSGGERQSVAIARAVYFGARVLILDEPTSALGVKQAGVVLRYIAPGARARPGRHLHHAQPAPRLPGRRQVSHPQPRPEPGPLRQVGDRQRRAGPHDGGRRRARAAQPRAAGPAQREVVSGGESLAGEVAQREAELVSLRRDLHRHPELAFGERRTAEIVAERLHRAGLEVTTDVGGTGVLGVLRGDRPGRTIGWRADMDALPLVEAVDVPFASGTRGVMHACGHDGHTAIAIVMAEMLAVAARVDARDRGLPLPAGRGDLRRRAPHDR